MRIIEEQLPMINELTLERITPKDFTDGYLAYKQARDAHKFTINIPAPFPEFEIYRVLYDRNEMPEIVPDVLRNAPQGRDIVKELDDLKAKTVIQQLQELTPAQKLILKTFIQNL